MSLNLTYGSTVIPGHLLLEQLGAGEFGCVWSAIGPGAIGKALKFISIDWSDPNRALREYCGIRRIKDVRGAFLVPITDIWLLDAQGQVLVENAIEQLERAVQESSLGLNRTLQAPIATPQHIVVAMELCERTLGQELKHHQEQGSRGIPVDILLGYLRDAARGLDFLHEKRHAALHGGRERVSLTHGDIKPDNIVIIGGGAKLCDFTLAEALDASGDLLRKTMMRPAGTLFYMAPEIFLGQRSTSSDLYSLAITYCELRTGTLPFTNESRSSIGSLQEAKQRDNLDFSALPEAERRVLRRATAADRRKRYENCVQFVGELEEAAQLHRSGSIAPAPKSSALPLWLFIVATALVGLGLYFFIKGLLENPPASDRFSIENELQEPGLDGLRLAILQTKQFTPEEWRPIEDPIVARFAAEVENASNSPLDKSLQLLQHGVEISDRKPSEGARAKFDAAIALLASRVAELLFQDLDRLSADDLGGNELTNWGAHVTDVRGKFNSLESLEKQPAYSTQGLLMARLLARKKQFDNVPSFLPKEDQLPAAHRPIHRALALLVKIVSLKRDKQWPPRSIDDVREMARSINSINDIEGTWEHRMLKQFETELLSNDRIEPAWFLDQELSAGLVGKGRFGERHLEKFAVTLKAQRNKAVDYASLRTLANSKSDWISAEYAEKLKRLIDQESAIAILTKGQDVDLLQLIENWPRKESVIIKSHVEVLDAAIDALSLQGGASNARYALLRSLKDEFDPQPQGDEEHLNFLVKHAQLKPYGYYVQALRCERLGEGRYQDAEDFFRLAYPDRPEADATNANKAKVQGILGQAERREAAATAVARMLLSRCPHGVPTDATLLSFDVVNSDESLLPIYRRIAEGLPLNSVPVCVGAEIVFLTNAVRDPEDVSAELERRGLAEAAQRLLGEPIAIDREGLLHLAIAFFDDPQNDGTRAAEHLAAGLTTLSPVLDAVVADNPLNAAVILDPAELTAKQLIKRQPTQPAKERLAEALCRLASWESRIAANSTGDQTQAFELYKEANILAPTPESGVGEAICQVFSTAWTADESQLKSLASVGAKFKNEPDELIRAGARMCLGLAAIGESRSASINSDLRASKLHSAIDNLKEPIAALRRETGAENRRRLVSCLVVKSTAHVEYSFYDVASKQELDESVVCAQEALGLDPEHVQAWRAKGNAHEDLALYLSESPTYNYREAVKCFEKARSITAERLDSELATEMATLESRADLARCRKRWLAAGLVNRKGQDKESDRQIEELIKEFEQRDSTVQIATENLSVRQQAAELLFFLAQGLSVCNQPENASLAAKACRELADADDPSTAVPWCEATLMLAGSLRSTDREECVRLAKSVLAHPKAPASAVASAASLCSDSLETYLQAIRAAETPDDSRRSAELSLYWADEKVDSIVTESLLQKSTDGKAALIDDLLQEVRPQLDRVTLQSRRKFEAKMGIQRAFMTQFKAINEYLNVTDGEADTADIADATLAFYQSIDAYDREVLPPSVYSLLKEDCDDWKGKDYLLIEALKTQYQATARYRRICKVWAFKSLEALQKANATSGEIASELIELLPNLQATSEAMGDPDAVNDRAGIERLLQELEK